MSMLRPDVQSEVSRTKQSFRAESDINAIVAKAKAGGAVTHLARNVPTYKDVSEVGDYKGALDMLRRTDAFFAALPSKIRLGFDNDPAVFLDAMDTTEGRAKLEELGMIPKRPQARSADGRFAGDANEDGVADAATP